MMAVAVPADLHRICAPVRATQGGSAQDQFGDINVFDDAGVSSVLALGRAPPPFAGGGLFGVSLFRPHPGWSSVVHGQPAKAARICDPQCVTVAAPPLAGPSTLRFPRAIHSGGHELILSEDSQITRKNGRTGVITMGDHATLAPACGMPVSCYAACVAAVERAGTPCDAFSAASVGVAGGAGGGGPSGDKSGRSGFPGGSGGGGGGASSGGGAGGSSGGGAGGSGGGGSGGGGRIAGGGGTGGGGGGSGAAGLITGGGGGQSSAAPCASAATSLADLCTQLCVLVSGSSTAGPVIHAACVALTEYVARPGTRPGDAITAAIACAQLAASEAEESDLAAAEPGPLLAALGHALLVVDLPPALEDAADVARVYVYNAFGVPPRLRRFQTGCDDSDDGGSDGAEHVSAAAIAAV